MDETRTCEEERRTPLSVTNDTAYSGAEGVRDLQGNVLFLISDYSRGSSSLCSAQRRGWILSNPGFAFPFDCLCPCLEKLSWQSYRWNPFARLLTMAIQGDPAAVACRLVQSLRCDRYRWRKFARLSCARCSDGSKRELMVFSSRCMVRVNAFAGNSLKREMGEITPWIHYCPQGDKIGFRKDWSIFVS